MSKSIAHANRGQGLEQLIEYANQQYAAKGIAQIQKVATPWKVIRKGKQIVSAFPEKKSTVDFIGVYKGQAIAFDAKQTENTTRFPFANIEEHQDLFMYRWMLNGGYAFYLIEFKAHNELFFVPHTYLSAFGGMENRKSIPYEHLKAKFPTVKQGDGIVLDYLKHVEDIA